MCPHCGQNAPIVYRGVVAVCAGCGRQRPALIAPSVSYAGKPSKVGGTVAGVVGWVVLAVGLAIALGIGLLLSIVSTTFGLAVGVPIGIISIAVSIALLFSGRKLRRSGEAREKEVRRRAVMSLAANRKGKITANDAAAALDIPPAEADAFLTDMAKQQNGEVSLEIDDGGGVYYVFPRFVQHERRRIEDPRVRVTGVPSTFESEGLEYEEPAEEKRRRGL